ncbi:hypothetical protein pEaSNUABM40_00207 [Erwinia phage pEa_SNUABM_40]|uniref:Uncharacterized protein n=1 Tax=Erwinia phage pEa_SNUABM_3 TaxID=2869552 RepID=A0AAE7XJ61_9CAUD|nr:hypothetical protein MPK68_gp204 [Erwinia phage pEa_SNUABM_3]QZE56740.1 hypothetical protein pEaSNUABM20_00204 [Erwinia phage pEa_SNUABM_20]QZE58423.1 hypothetical protein pEaSNUABM40_00207 [Erwinia phage pEa_SNUABM_40]UAW52985.1 hypothetical protein pEaSNUABM23_00203 [Erwinia phage pEa_SNUABM_23]UIW10881.1 hypothetical protein pEaSNUABM23_00203 [Erwinia phage pEa_SNUABM_31]QZE56401.1 hypothetical protein pEaSNUABM3_00204 [Erwinia phage pEa_SNUABM_3]
MTTKTALPLWRLIKPVVSDTRDESISYDVIAEAGEPYTDDEIEVFEQTHGKGLIQEQTCEYI